MTEIRLITFDLDNTLWDVRQVIIHAEQQMRRWLDEHVPEYSAMLDAERIAEIRRDAVADNPSLGHDVSALRTEVLRRGIRLCGYAESSARHHAISAFETFFEARQQVVFFEHALESLGELAGEYQLAALTNGNADITRIGLDRYFSFAFSSADVAASKPAPDIFHAALKQAGVGAAQAIHVGDNLIDDIHGAGDIGMHTIWVNHPQHAAGPTDASHVPPTVVVGHLRELAQAVRAIHDDATAPD